MSRTWRLASPQTGTDYVVDVAVPDAARDPGPWPVLIVLDGFDQFPLAVAAYRDGRSAGTVAPVLVVGVGYGATYLDPSNRRARDYTPTRSEEEPTSGGADAFLAFLTDTLWPELARRWPLRADVRGLAGHSVGALLVLHALFQPRPFFARYLAGAPSVWWDRRAILCQAARLREAQPTLTAQLFLGIGDQDSASMLADFEQLTDQLADRPFAGLAVSRAVFPGRTHYDAPPEVFRAGLAALFPPA